MSTEQNKQVVRRLIEEGVNRGDERTIEALIAPDFVSRAEDTPAAGVEGFKEAVGAFRSAFPDTRLSIEHIIAEGDLVMTRGRFTSTHQGPLEGMPPTGKRVEVKDVDLWRLRDGRVVEAWAHFDRLGMMQQVGAISMPEGG